MSPFGSSTSASGFPPVSAMICSTTAAPTVTVSDCSQQGAGILRCQAADDHRRQPRKLAAHRPGAEHQPHRLRAEPAPHEGEDLRRRPVEPLLVVDDAQERPVRSRLGEQAQHSQAGQEPVGHGPTPREAETRRQRDSLRGRDGAHVLHQWPTQLVKSRERELHLRLHAGDTQDAAPRGDCPLREILQQRGLSYACFTGDQECFALAALQLRNKFIEPGALAVTADKPDGRSTDPCTRIRHGNQARRPECRPAGRTDRKPPW